MFRSEVSLETVNARHKDTMVDHLGIEIIEVGEDYMVAKMPVDHRTKQPLGLLHGGASLALAETLGSVAANCVIDLEKQYCVGLEINANHIKSAKSGYVYGTTKPIHLGRKTHVWEIKIRNEAKQLTCISRITMAVIEKK